MRHKRSVPFHRENAVGVSPIGAWLNFLIHRRSAGTYKEDGSTPAGDASNRSVIHQGGTAMLVLTRKTNESIYIDGGIEVMVVQVRGNRVRLGFRAPSDVSIQRKERMVDPPVATDSSVRHGEMCTAALAGRDAGARSR
jgi:carbon storage regulator